VSALRLIMRRPLRRHLCSRTLEDRDDEKHPSTARHSLSSPLWLPVSRSSRSRKSQYTIPRTSVAPGQRSNRACARGSGIENDELAIQRDERDEHDGLDLNDARSPKTIECSHSMAMSNAGVFRQEPSGDRTWWPCAAPISAWRSHYNGHLGTRLERRARGARRPHAINRSGRGPRSPTPPRPCLHASHRSGRTG
jgi:hypothetical protein